MGRDDEWPCGGEWIRGDEWIPGDEWARGNTAHVAGYGETAVVPGAAWTTVWGHEAGDEAGEDEADEDDWPDDDLLDDEWPDGESLEDESPDGEWPGGEPFAAPGGPAGPGPGFGYRTGGWGHGGIPGFSSWIAVAVAVAAAVAGVAVGFFLTRGASAASAVGGVRPSASAPALGGGGGPHALPGLPGNGDGQLRMLLTGQVLAVSGTSVTIGGTGPSVTAAVTSATKLTGRVRGIGGVKVGDEVAAQITGTSRHLVITSLQDPVQ
jgi:hypothetical protein